MNVRRKINPNFLFLQIFVFVSSLAISSSVFGSCGHYVLTKHERLLQILDAKHSISLLQKDLAGDADPSPSCRSEDSRPNATVVNRISHSQDQVVRIQSQQFFFSKSKCDHLPQNDHYYFFLVFGRLFRPPR